MTSLFIDTANKKAALAIISDDRLIKEIKFTSNNDLSSIIFNKIDKLFVDSNIDVNQIERIYIGIGPGSFTGTRIGLTIAKVFAFTRKIEIVPISSLEIIASKGNEPFIIPFIDARRGFVFAGFYNNNLDKLKEEEYINYEEIKNIKAEFITDDSDEREIDILKLVNKHQFDSPASVFDIKPNYLKATEAEENNDNRV